MNAAALYGQFSSSLLLGAAVSLLPIPHRRLVGILAAALAGFTVAPTFYGLIGAISFTLTQVAVMRLCALEMLISKEITAATLLVMLAAVFYPLSLGLGPYDPFDLGYRPRVLLLLIAIAGTVLVWRGRRALLVIIGLDVLAYAIGFFDNLWNALFDPILVGLAATVVVTNLSRRSVQLDGSIEHSD